MKLSIVAATLLSAISLSAFTPAVYAAVTPCEDMLVKLSEAEKTAKPSDANLVAFNDLKAKAQERCTAEDDRRSNGFVEEALKLLAAK